MEPRGSAVESARHANAVAWLGERGAGALEVGRRQLLIGLAAAAISPAAVRASDDFTLPVASRTLFSPGNFWVWGYFEGGSDRVEDVRAYELYSVLSSREDHVELAMSTLYPKDAQPSWLLHDCASFDYDEVRGVRANPYLIGRPMSVAMSYWDGTAFRPSTKNFRTSPVEEKFNFYPYVGQSGMASTTNFATYDGLTIEGRGAETPMSWRASNGREPVFQVQPAITPPKVFMSYFGADGVARYKLFNPGEDSVCAMRLVHQHVDGEGKMTSTLRGRTRELEGFIHRFENPASRI